jgi:hypothetical protein
MAFIMCMPSPGNLYTWKTALALCAVMLALMPAPVRAACLVRVPDGQPQPLAEPCDSVLLSHEGVTVNLFDFTAALAVLLAMLPALSWLAWHPLPRYGILAQSISLAPDVPPPRIAA